MRPLIAILLGVTVGVSSYAQSAKNGLVDATAALQAGEADKALGLLSSLKQPQATSAQAHNIRCRVYFALEQWEAAGRECEQAVNLDGQNSDYHMWLGRALGERADRASFVSAYSLAKRARAEFEQAVQLNPRNAEALADLGEFYKSAPGVVGGGVSKAEGVAAQLDKIDPARAHELRGRIATGNKDFDGAEREFKQAIAVSQHPAFQWTTLASFYRKRERWNDMDSALKSAMEAVERDRHSGVALYNGASLLIKSNRDPALAVKMLETYLTGPTKTEEAPAFVAHVWLARLHAQRGDSAAAQREHAAALALTKEYKPARDLKD